MSDENTAVDKAPAKESGSKSGGTCASATDKLALVFASILCRLWLGVRALQTGIEKYAGQKASNEEVLAGGESTGLFAGTVEKAYSIKAYSGVGGLKPQLEEEPLMLGFMLDLFDKVLGPALILMGITVLLGIFTRISLLAQGLLYTGLTWGLILLNQSSGVAWLGVHMVLVVLALGLIKHDCFTLPSLIKNDRIFIFKILKKW